MGAGVQSQPDEMGSLPLTQIRADFWEGDATKHFSVKKGLFSEKGGGNSVNWGFGKDF